MSSARLENRSHMPCFYFRTIGCLAHTPELVTADDGSYYTFCLTGHDYTEDERGHLKVELQSLWFVASHAIGTLITMGASKGDRLIVEGKIRKHRGSEKGQHHTSFVVTAFQFGARHYPGSPAASTAIPPEDNPPQLEDAQAAIDRLTRQPRQ